MSAHDLAKRRAIPEGRDPVSVFFCVRCGVSYRDSEEISSERGISVDYATPNRWGLDTLASLQKLRTLAFGDKGRVSHLMSFHFLE